MTMFGLPKTATLAILAATIASSGFAQDVQTKQYDDGGVYEGTFVDGKQDGTGTYRLPNGYEYTGQWVAGEIRGQGIATFPNGSVYEGTFVAGKPEGQGRITFADGGTFEGEWVDGNITGPRHCRVCQRRRLRGRIPQRDAQRHRHHDQPRRLYLRRRMGEWRKRKAKAKSPIRMARFMKAH